MSTLFKPLEIPPGVVSTATKKMHSSNWSEVNLVRWAMGQLSPIGGQSHYAYQFASRCKAVHGWFDLAGTYHTAYLCEQHLYVDTAGALIDISPTPALTPPTPTTLGGYGDGVYDYGTYGTPRPVSDDVAIDRVPAAYSLANFGALLLAMTSADGRLLVWDPVAGGAAAAVTPKAGSTVPRGWCFVVTPERFVQIFGAVQDGTTGTNTGGSFRRFSWCEQEDFTNWSYSDSTTQAGFIDIEPASPIICAISTRTGTLFFTSKKAYRSRYLGLPYVYNYDELGDNCTPWSPQSMAATSSMVLWFSQQGPWSYDGTSILPVQCPVRPWIDDDIDLLNVRAQACAVHVANFNEFWWFFPQAQSNSGTPYNTRCVIYNYRDGWWSMGRMSRSAGITASYTSHTIMADGFDAYEHEHLYAYNHAELPWAETFDLNLTPDARLITVKQMMPDVEGAVDYVVYSLFYRNSRSVGLPEQQTFPQTVRPNGYVDFRTTGRDIRLRIDFTAPPGTIINGVAADGQVYPVTVGQCLIDAAPRGIADMAAHQQTPQSARIPPDVPADPSISPPLGQFLRNFALWCRNGFAEQMRNNEAHPGVLVRSWNTLPGHTPKIFLIRVSEAGVVDAAPVSISGDMTRRSVESAP